MRVLITNDDGIEADGMKCLAAAMDAVSEVTVVAPDREQSGCGHAITLNRPLRVLERETNWFAIDGTPTDCVNFGVHHLMKGGARPDLVLSGINHGVNLGDDVTYSGTVGGATEGHLLGIPSVALSQELGEQVSYKRSAEVCAELIERFLELPDRESLFLNVNVPAEATGEVEVTSLGHRRYHEVIQARTDPRGGEYFWIAGQPTWREAEGTDQSAVARGVISVTPLHLGLTDERRLIEGSPLLEVQAAPVVAARFRGGSGG